jgi:hypothetical protein
MMNRNSGRDEEAVENGTLLRHGETREIAIYQRGGLVWVADFRGGQGELFTAADWFAVHGHGSLLHRAGLGAVAPLPADVIERIERLHAAEDRAGMPALTARFLDRLTRFCRGLSRRAPAGATVPRTQRS